MLIAKVKNSQSEMVNTGYLFQNTYHVDDSLTDGIKAACFAGIKGDGKIAGLYGDEVVSTLQYADATHMPVGVIYKETRMSQYAGQLDQLIKAEEGKVEVLKPYGNLEDTAIGLLRQGVMEISDTEDVKYRHFRTTELILDAANVVGAEVAAGADITITIANSTVKVGEPVLVGSLKAVVKTVSASEVVITALETVAADTYEIVAPSLIGYPVYLNLAQATDGELPFTANRASGKMVGWIESPIAVRFNVNLAL